MDASALNNPRLKALIEDSLIDLAADDVVETGKEEQKKAMANELVAKLTFLCWDKCVTGSVGSSFSRSETSCLSNCAKRFAEVKMMTIQRFTGRS